MPEISNGFVTDIIIPLAGAAIGIMIFHLILGIISYHKSLWGCLNLAIWSYWATNCFNIVIKLPTAITYTFKYVITEFGNITFISATGIVIILTIVAVIPMVLLAFICKGICDRLITIK